MSYLEDNGTFTFDGVNSADYGVWITGANTYSAPPRRFEEITIPGKNGVLTLDQRAFEDIEHTYPAFIRRNFPSNIEGIRNQLLSRSGKKVLTDSYHPDEFYLAKFMQGVDVEVGSRAIAGRFDLVFKRDPRRFLKSGETAVTIGEWGETTEHSGSIATFEAVDSDAVKSLKVSLEPVQSGSGDPSPTNVRPISGWTGAKVTRCGKNLLALMGENTTDVIPTINETTGEVSIADTTAIKWASKPFGYSDVVAEQTYIFSATGIKYGRIGGSMNTVYPNAVAGNIPDCTTSGDGITSLVTQSVTARTFTPHFTGRIYWHFCTDTNNGSSHQAFTMTPMIELGSTATDYEPYQGETYTTDLGGTYYGGTLDVVSGVLTVDRAMIDLGTLNYTYDASIPRFYSTGIKTSVKSPQDNYHEANAISSAYKVTAFERLYTTDKLDGTFAVGNTGTLNFINRTYTTAADFKSAMSGVQLVYELATPQTIQLTPQQVALLVGTNNIWSDSGDVTVEVGPNPNMLVNPTLFASKPLIRVTGYGTLTVGSDVITIANNFAYVDIDSEVGDCYHGTDNANASVSFQQNDFPELAPGATGIAYSGHITKVEITPRWWRL